MSKWFVVFQIATAILAFRAFFCLLHGEKVIPFVVLIGILIIQRILPDPLGKGLHNGRS